MYVVENINPDGWASGYYIENNSIKGLFPLNYVEVVEDIIEPVEYKPVDLIFNVKAIQGHTPGPGAEDQLPLTPGDNYRITHEGADFYLGYNLGDESQKEGIIFKTFVGPIEEEDIQEETETVKDLITSYNLTKITPYTAIVLYQFTPIREGQIPLFKGANYVVKYTSKDWSYGYQENNADKIGLFPTSYIKKK